MIRRDIQFGDGVPAWLLISQVEHARISGALTAAWRDSYSNEVVAAITHHDDGWAAWEADPQLDTNLGRPLSFLEMSIADSLAIWEASIDACQRIGLLAAAMVAGHFIGLASGSDQASHPAAAQWLRDMTARRAAWLAEWKTSSPASALATAQRSQQMLLTADLLSLWLCLDGPVSADGAAPSSNAEMESRSIAVLGKYCFDASDKATTRNDVAWQGTLRPWPFSVPALELAAPGMAAAARRYTSWQSVVAASWPVQLRWSLHKSD